MTRNIYRSTVAVVSTASVLALAACFGGDDDTAVAQSAAGSSVPDSAGTSGSALVGFLQALMSTDETSEPSTISTSFAVPPDETSDPQPLI